ncbi:MAG: hypothetical protein C0614_07680 [Desulfuromonas sp.]|nr:MAG: hypothetical protein C0614_07680 [Desulfuromonas sp.]
MCLLRLTTLLAVGCLLWSATVSFAATPAKGMAIDRAQIAYDRGLAHYQEGRLAEAAGLLRGFLVSHPESPLVADTYRTLAAIHISRDEAALALDYIVKIPENRRRPSDTLLEGRLRIRSGAVADGTGQLMALPIEGLTLPERQQRALLLAAGQAELGEPQSALHFLYQALQVEGDLSPDEVLARIYALMDTQFSTADLAEAAFMYQDTPIAQLAQLKLGWRALAHGKKDTARQRVTQSLEGPVGFAYRDEALTLLSQLTDTSQLQRAIGVLLPLTGRYAAFGKLVQRGMEQARADFRPTVPVRFIYRDTAGDAVVVQRQTTDLAISERVLAIAGPLVGSVAEAAAADAARQNIPMLTLSQKDGLAATSPYVFRNSLTAQLQVDALVTHSMDDLGMTRFGIMHPETRQGQLMADLFTNAVEMRGGEIIARESYLTEQTDFRRQVRLLQGLDPNAPDEEEDTVDENGAKVEKEEVPPPFEALFLPDYADRIGLVAPQLPFYGLEDIQLLGTNGWNDPTLLKTAGKFIEGALFVDGFFRHSPYPFVQEFADTYFATYGEDPTILEAQGYDVAGILLTLLNDPRTNSRAGLRWALAQMPFFPGITGATRFDSQGEAIKTLYLLQVKDGVITQLN